MSTRLDRVLTKLVQRHAAYLLQKTENAINRQAELAAGLARVGVLVIMADVPDNLVAKRDDLINDWVSAYGNFYFLLTDRLFPSFTSIDAVYADGQHPAIVVITGESTIVIETLARFVVPYISARQNDKIVSEAELNGVMNFVLEELEASDLPPHDYHDLNKSGSELLKSLLDMPVRQATLTDFKRPMFKELGGQIPETQPPPPPPTMPEDIPEPPMLEETPTRQMFVSQIPIFYDRSRSNPSKRRPPIPDLPTGKKPKNN